MEKIKTRSKREIKELREEALKDVKKKRLDDKPKLDSGSEGHSLKGQNPFAENLEKFHGETVEVTTVLGDKTRGECLAITKHHLNIIIDTGKDIIIIKNVYSIKRNKK